MRPKSFFSVLAAAGAMLFLAPAALAATNQGTGDIAGDATALTASNVFNLSASQLALVKKAFLASTGAPITDGTSVPKGTLVKFMIYVNNNTAVSADDIAVTDALNAAFVYQAGTIKIDNSVANCAAVACTPAEEAAILAAANLTAAKTDGVDGDVVSYDVPTTTIHAGKRPVVNGQANVAANSVWAMVFTVKMN